VALPGTLLFTVLVPGTVAGVVPWLLRGRAPLPSPLAAVDVMAGALAVVAGAALYAWCAWDFATVGDGTPSPTAPPRQLVRGGPYRWSRNPMYVGVLLVVAGQAAWARSPATWAYAAALALAFHLRVTLAEEPALRRAFGDGFDAYAARVPRWIGRPRRDGV
jgi:protein-S-isoprenylcysteine O-methyltransferase Ste14